MDFICTAVFCERINESMNHEPIIGSDTVFIADIMYENLSSHYVFSSAKAAAWPFD